MHKLSCLDITDSPWLLASCNSSLLPPTSNWGEKVMLPCPFPLPSGSAPKPTWRGWKMQRKTCILWMELMEHGVQVHSAAARHWLQLSPGSRDLCQPQRKACCPSSHKGVVCGGGHQPQEGLSRQESWGGAVWLKVVSGLTEGPVWNWVYPSALEWLIMGIMAELIMKMIQDLWKTMEKVQEMFAEELKSK